VGADGFFNVPGGHSYELAHGGILRAGGPAATVPGLIGDDGTAEEARQLLLHLTAWFWIGGQALQLVESEKFRALKARPHAAVALHRGTAGGDLRVLSILLPHGATTGKQARKQKKGAETVMSHGVENTTMHQKWIKITG